MERIQAENLSDLSMHYVCTRDASLHTQSYFPYVLAHMLLLHRVQHRLLRSLSDHNLKHFQLRSSVRRVRSRHWLLGNSLPIASVNEFGRGAILF